MEPRLTLITLGVADVARARRFYEALGFKAARASEESVAFLPPAAWFSPCGAVRRSREDATVADSEPGFSGIALAHNARSETEVDKAIAEAMAAGAKLIKPAGKTFWGGYAGYFADPDGHLWEVAYNPYFRLDEAGRVALD